MNEASLMNRLGWISVDRMTDEQREIHLSNVAKLPSFALPFGDKPPVGTKVMLTGLWKHQATIDALGFAFPGWLQDSGCCVGVGGGNAVQTLILADFILKNDPDNIFLFAWYYNYGKSRLRGGMRGRGEGSFGSSFAESLAQDGALSVKHPGLDNLLPDGNTNRGMVSIGESAEMDWSDGNYASSAIQIEAKKYPVKSYPCKSAEQVREAILNGYPVTRASEKFVRWNKATVRNGVLFGRHEYIGGHQESWPNYWNHPQLGEIFYEMNQHGQNAYGTDPAGGPLGGAWVSFEDVDRLCKEQNGEVYAITGLDGMKDRKEQVLDWSNGNNPFLS